MSVSTPTAPSTPKATKATKATKKETAPKATAPVKEVPAPEATKEEAKPTKADLLASLRLIRQELKNRNEGDEKGTPDFSTKGEYDYAAFIVAVEAAKVRCDAAIELAQQLQQAK